MRFWMFVIGGLTCCAVLIGGTVVTARSAMPPAPGILLFSRPDGSACEGACMFGVRVGETDYEDAVMLFEAHPLTRDLVRSESLGRNGMIFQSQKVGIGLSRDARGRLSLIDFLVEPQIVRPTSDALPEDTPLEHLTLGDIVSALGSPDFIEFGSTGVGRTLRAYYQQFNLQVVFQRISETRVSEHDPLLYIFMYPQPLDIRPGMNRWEGFTSFLRYFNAAFRR